MHPGYIVISNLVIGDQDHWCAAFYKRCPPSEGPSHCDEVLVESISKAARSRETALAAARRKKPHAVIIER